MQTSADESSETGKAPVVLNRIVTPAHIKISAVSNRDGENGIVDDVIDLPAEGEYPLETDHGDDALDAKEPDQENPTQPLSEDLPFFLQEPATPSAPIINLTASIAPKRREKTPVEYTNGDTKSLKNMGLAAAGLVVAILVMLVLWHTGGTGETNEVAGDQAPPAAPAVAIVTADRPKPAPVAPLQSKVEVENISVLSALVPLPPVNEVNSDPGIPAMPKLLERPNIIGPSRIDGHSVSDATALPETTTPPQALKKPKPMAPKEAEDIDIIQQLTLTTVAALRSGVTKEAEADAVVFEFVENARKSGRTETAIDALLNAAHQGRTLDVPEKFIRANGLIDTVAIFAAMEANN